MSGGSSHGYRVLVVEDEPLVGMLIEDMLESLGCIIVGPVAELEEAMKRATHDSCDCAILDVNIRGGSISPVAAALLDQGVPLLITSGYGNLTLPGHLATQPQLAKPYTSSQLKDCICALCDRVSVAKDREASRQPPFFAQTE